MRNLFEAIAEYMSAEGADARRDHAKKVRIEFDLVQDRMLEMQSRIEALEKDATRYRWIRSGERAIPEINELHLDMYFEDELDAAIDTAMKSEKGGV